MKKSMLLSIAIGVCSSPAFAAGEYKLNVSSSLTAEDPMFKGLNQFRRSREALGRQDRG